MIEPVESGSAASSREGISCGGDGTLSATRARRREVAGSEGSSEEEEDEEEDEEEGDVTAKRLNASRIAVSVAAEI